MTDGLMERNMIGAYKGLLRCIDEGIDNNDIEQIMMCAIPLAELARREHGRIDERGYHEAKRTLEHIEKEYRNEIYTTGSKEMVYDMEDLEDILNELK